ncbi:hypothetical protein QZH41_019232, partial [Actinostola sp. cb2023]
MDYEKVGCYIDKFPHEGGRALPSELLNERDPTNPNYDGHEIDWNDEKGSYSRLACRCAAKSREDGFDVFGLQFWGECWSGSGNFNRHGMAAIDRCIEFQNNICKNQDKEVCVGKQLTNYVYRLKPSNNSVDGGYSRWSEWTPCSKSCGGGVQSRTRTCTYPTPRGNGKDCSHLGPSVETMACENDVCPVPCNKVLDVGIILDGSGSVRLQNFKKAKKVIQRLVDFFAVGPMKTRIGIVVYSNQPKIKYWLNAGQNPVQLKALIGGLNYPRGGTNTAKALRVTAQKLFKQQKGNRMGVPDVVIVFTDGHNNGGTKPVRNVINSFYKNIDTVAVGIGKNVDKGELKVIAHGNNGNVIRAKNFNKLHRKIGIIVKRAC